MEAHLSGSTLTVLEGKALEPKEPRRIEICGILDSPLRWIDSRKEQLPAKQCNIVVNRDKMSITLTVGETEHYNTVITGALSVHPDFLKFKINTGEYLTSSDMAQLIKMNRSFFENQSVAMNLVHDLQNFKAKVDREIELADNNRGNTRLLKEQTVESNLPESFKLNLPVFKGTEKLLIEVEVYIKPDDLCCTLISPQANDIIQDIRDRAIDEVVEKIRSVTAEIVIIEV